MEDKKIENFSLINTVGAARLALGGLGATASIYTLYKIYKAEKERRALAKKISYLQSRINPQTMKVERVDDGRLANFAVLPMLGSLLFQSAAFIGADRVIDHVTSVEFRAKRQIKQKHNKIFNDWCKNRYEDVKNGFITKSQFNKEKAINAKRKDEAIKDEYLNWKTREEFIKESARNYYNSLQKEIPGPEEMTSKSENFALFKDFIPQPKEKDNIMNNNVNVSPNVFDFIKLDAAKGLLATGNTLLKNLFLSKDRIKDAVRRLILIEVKIDSMLNVSDEKKELLKFEAFKNILSEFKNPEDIDKIFILKEKQESKMGKRSNDKVSGKATNFENNFLDDERFNNVQNDQIKL